MSKKMGFGAVLAIVFGSQIGSGIFVLPATLAPFGMFGVFGWCIAGSGAVLLAFIFAELCSKFPRTGGPHVYVEQAFGKTTGFFVGWIYWLVSWTSTSVVIIAAVASLNVFLGGDAPHYIYLLLEIGLLCIITAINCKSVNLAGKVESVLALLKFIPFALVPILLFRNFDVDNIGISPQHSDWSTIRLIIAVTMESFWGFIGVECATTPAGVVENPSKTIPRAIIIGTLGVAAIYFVNNLAVMGAIPGNVLAISKSPYVDAINLVLGKNISIIVSIITFVIMVGTSNAWTLASAQISLGLAQEGLLPAFFAKKNKNLSPYISILISSIGIIPILILSKNQNLSEQINNIINFSVEVFLMVYAMCCLAFIKINMRSKRLPMTILGVVAFCFCLTIILNSSVQSIMVALLFPLSGVFMLPFARKL